MPTMLKSFLLVYFRGWRPGFFKLNSWKEALLKLTYETLRMSIMAIGFSTIAMFLTVIPAARNIANGSLTFKKMV